MSPFAIYLRALRLSRGLKQQDVARLLGYEPSYLSALERSAKGPPRQAFIARLVRVLGLSSAEQAELNEALIRSKRQVCLPWTASLEEYELIRELEPQLGRLNSAQIALIRHVLTLPTCPRNQTPGGLDEACSPSRGEKAMT
ncbi:helix-turn-helix domain-containing protein [Bordetella pseudohinzii]|uniref:helix-turn-helix domain-containing protein n=1 Tax=Bordetella pseudohinzii TaxID=1331258 RepID=UPI0009E3DFE5